MAVCCRSLLVLACAAAYLPESATARIVERVHHDADGEHRYSVYVPRGTAPDAGWPVMLYLHGAGGRGNDGQRHLQDGPAPLLAEGLIDWPILVVFPQCENVESPIFECWLADSEDAHRALRILAEVERDYATDSQARILSGWSMGGYGAWSIAAATADRWSAVMPIAGGGDIATAPRLTGTPIWAIHGRLDQAILAERSRDMTQALRRAGGTPTLTLLTGVDHGSWRFALASEAVLDWFLNPQVPPQGGQLEGDVQFMIQTDFLADLDRPFTPELVIPHAVSVRFGERALEAIGYGIPTHVAPHPLGSELDDVHVSIETPSVSYDVDLTQLAYQASLQRCVIRTLDQGRAQIRLGLSPLDIVIGQTQVSNPELLVTADETLVRVGHRRPVWAEMEVRPVIEDHRLRLHLESVEFVIPDDNWFVRAPAGIIVHDETFSAEDARIGIVGGLYQRRDLFESCIRDTLPSVVEVIESSLAPGDMEHLAAAIWPLPVYQPRLRLRLDDLAVDQHGISLMLGLEADPAVGLPPGRGPRVLDPLGPPAADIRHSDWLEFGIAPGILAPLAQMLIDAGAARIDLSDLPHPQLAELGERERLCEFVPALLDYPEEVDVKAELVMVQAFDLEPVEALETCDVQAPPTPNPELWDGPSKSIISAAFHANGLSIRVSTRLPGLDSEWQPLAEFQLALEQSMLGELVRHKHQQRAVDVRWDGPPRLTVSGRYAGAADFQQASHSLDPIDSDRLADLFANGWQAWTASVASPHIDAPDVVFGPAPLRIDRLQASSGMQSPAGTPVSTNPASSDTVWWLATYSSPEVELSNAGSQSLTYQVRSPLSIWGAPRELSAGARDTYRVPWPLTVRVVEPFRSRNMTVNAGQDFELPTGL